MSRPELVLEIGTVYGYGNSDNRFEIIGIHGDYLWIEWKNDDPEEEEFVESHYADTDFKKDIILLE